MLWLIFVFPWIILLNNGRTEASQYSLVNKTVTKDGKPILSVEQQRYSRKYNTTFNDEIISWSYLYTATSPVPVYMCSNLCMDHPECVSFFYNTIQGANPNCFLNSQALRSDHYKTSAGIDYFELSVRASLKYIIYNWLPIKSKQENV